MGLEPTNVRFLVDLNHRKVHDFKAFVLLIVPTVRRRKYKNHTKSQTLEKPHGAAETVGTSLEVIRYGDLTVYNKERQTRRYISSYMR